MNPLNICITSLPELYALIGACTSPIRPRVEYQTPEETLRSRLIEADLLVEEEEAPEPLVLCQVPWRWDEATQQPLFKFAAMPPDVWQHYASYTDIPCERAYVRMLINKYSEYAVTEPVGHTLMGMHLVPPPAVG